MSRRRRSAFPIEPHSLLPAAHWLPLGAAAAATGGWGPAAGGRRRDQPPAPPRARGAVRASGAGALRAADQELDQPAIVPSPGRLRDRDAAHRPIRNQLRCRAARRRGCRTGGGPRPSKATSSPPAAELDTEGIEIGDPGEIAWFPDRTYSGRTYVPAVARTSEGYELFGYRLVHGGRGTGPSDFRASADFTSELAEANPDWKLDLNDEVIGSWRGELGNTADITLVWGVPLVAGGELVTAELANLAVDQCELIRPALHAGRSGQLPLGLPGDQALVKERRRAGARVALRRGGIALPRRSAIRSARRAAEA